MSRNLPPALGEWNHRLEAALAYLERLGAELFGLEPPALAELPQRLIEFREILHPTSPTRG